MPKNEISDRFPADSGQEVIRLRQEYEAISQQVKQLVKTESKLYAYQDKLDVQVKEYKALYELSKKFNTNFDVARLFEYTVDYVIHQLEYERVLIFRQSESFGAYAVRALDGYYNEEDRIHVTKLALDQDDPVLEPFLAGAEYLICKADTEHGQLAQHRAKLLMDEYLIYPLGSPPRPLALLAVGNSAKNAAFYRRVTDSEGALLGMGNLVGLLTSSIENHIFFASMEKALEQERLAEAKYRLIVDTANEGIWVQDEDGKTSFVNAQMAEMLGDETEGMIGREITSFIFEEDLPDHAQRMEKRRRGVAEHYERRWRRKDGQAVWTIVSATPIIDAENRFHGSSAMILDITERKQLEEQLRQAQKMESIGTLAGGVAHDFNNILTTIIGYGHIALRNMVKDEPNRFYIEQILQASDRAAHLTKDLLLFSRKQPLERKPIDLNEGIGKLGKFLVRVIGEDIVFKILLSGGTIPVLADEHQIGQVLMNFATNSRDAMPKGGTFTIATERVHLDEDFTSKQGLGTPGTYALISVSDTGHGMDEGTSQRIFEPFYTTKEVGKGTGLGLAVVYGIVKQHEGCINVHSEPGIGTTFKIYMPVIVSDIAEEKATAAEEKPVGGTETILLAEDNESVRNLIVSVLKESGYTVITAVDGEDAVRKYRENKDTVQLLLFDLIMPKKNGKEAYDEISRIHSPIKAIFASGYSPDLIRDKAALRSGTTVVYKPISPMDLLKKVRSMLDEGAVE